MQHHKVHFSLGKVVNITSKISSLSHSSEEETRAEATFALFLSSFLYSASAKKQGSCVYVCVFVEGRCSGTSETADFGIGNVANFVPRCICMRGLINVK